MASSPKQTTHNFTKVFQALQYVSLEVAPILWDVIKKWHKVQISGIQRCIQPTVCPKNVKPRSKGTRTLSCENCVKWGSALEKVHCRLADKSSDIEWKNVDPTRLYDDPIEVCNAFAIFRPKHEQRPQRVQDYDIASVLKIIRGFGEFHQHQNSVSSCKLLGKVRCHFLIIGHNFE